MSDKAGISLGDGDKDKQMKTDDAMVKSTVNGTDPEHKQEEVPLGTVTTTADQQSGSGMQTQLQQHLQDNPLSSPMNDLWSDARSSPLNVAAPVHIPESQQPEAAMIAVLLDNLMVKVVTIEELYEDILKLDTNVLTINEVDCYEGLIREEWNALLEFQNSWMANLKSEHEYHTSGGYQRAARTRRGALLVMSRLKARLAPQLQSGPSTSGSTANHLPRIAPPTFNGDFTTWREFSDLFQSLVGRLDIPPVQKLVRLKDALTGPAKELLRSFSAVDANYDKAWEKLRSTYENPRLIAQTLFNRLLSMPKLNKPSAKQLAANVHVARETLDQLMTSAGIKREDLGEQFIVHLLRNTIDPETRKNLEVTIDTSTKFTTIQQLTDFLSSTARGLNASGVEDGKTEEEKKPTGHLQKRKKNSFQVSQNNEIPPPDPNKITPSNKCACCGGVHFVGKCSIFRSLSILKKREVIVKERLCYNCLGSHNVKACSCKKNCMRCDGRHHTLICEKKMGDSARSTPKSGDGSTSPAHQTAGDAQPTVVIDNQKPVTGNSPDHSINGQDIAVVNHQKSRENQQLVLLATAKARAYSTTGIFITARVLIDQGSELTFISEHLVNQLRLQRRSSTISLTGIGNTNSGITRGVVSVQLASTHQPHQQIKITAHILGRLTARLPSFPCSSANIGSLRQLQLADEQYHRPGPIEILIGADNYGRITQHKSLTTEDNQLVGQLTVFGWTLCGPLNITDCSSRKTLTAVRTSSNEQLLKLLQKFWVQEELPKINRSVTKESSPEDEECERHFQTTHSRDSTGRYIIRLPLRASPAELGESRSKALHQLYSVSRKLKKDPDYNKLYTDFINQYESLNHMRRAPTTPESSPTYYLPHHGVLRAESLTTKLRVVFNGSSETTSGVSLNDILYTGEKLQTDAIDVLTWMRKHKYLFGTDIKQMFRQINVHQDDWDLQRILWINENQRVVSYQLTTVTYGLSCSPWLSLRVLQQLANDEGHRFPKAIPAITKGRYVDDIYGGAESEEELEATILELQQLCMAGGFPLQKWASNKPEALDRLGLSLATSTEKSFEESIVKVLGICWHPSSDTFQYKARTFESTELTKRTLMSEIAQIFDPLGFITPVIIKAKVLIQELWLLKLNWDDPLPTAYVKRWNNFRQELTQLDQLAIPRWLGTSTKEAEIQVHGFADASTTALGAVVYLRIQRVNKEPSITLVCAKTRVAPLKKLTVPRLELTVALMLTDLVNYTKRMLENEKVRLILWTDSSVALAWITSHPSRWKEYVYNRVMKIQETLPDAQWRHVSGIDNPADCASRGISPQQLVDHQLWWTGPSWLRQSEDQWPQREREVAEDESTQGETAVEEKPTRSYPAIAVQVNEISSLLDSYPRLSKVLQVSATINRAILRFKRQPVPDTPVLTTEELEDARLFWVKLTQHQYYNNELRLLREGTQLSKNHHLLKLTPILDELGIMRLGGRLTNAPLRPDEIHPIILPRDSRLSELIIRHAHLKTLHGGTQQTLAYVREKYWIIGGRQPIKSVIQRCLRCTRFRAQRAYQLMGQLPAARVTPSKPFLHTGVDYAGPIPILKWVGKGADSDRLHRSVRLLCNVSNPPGTCLKAINGRIHRCLQKVHRSKRDS